MAAGRSLSRRPLLAGPAAPRGRIDGGTSLIAAAASTLGLAVAAAGTTLLLRRLGGGFAAVPSAAVPWAIAAVGIPLVIGIEMAARVGRERWPAWLARGGLAAAAVAAAPFAATTPWPAHAAGFAGVGAALIVALRPHAGWRAPRPWTARLASRCGKPVDAEPAEPGPEYPAGANHRDPVTGASPAPSVADRPMPRGEGFRQRLERYATPAGDDCVHGQVMLSVAAGSRTGHAHLGFCPAFASLPAVEVSTDCDFVEAEVVAAEILPWGVRVECRLSEPAEEPLEIPVTIRAVRTA